MTTTFWDLSDASKHSRLEGTEGMWFQGGSHSMQPFLLLWRSEVPRDLNVSSAGTTFRHSLCRAQQ